MGEVRRVYVEKKKDYAVKAKELHASLKQYLGLDVESVRVLVRYDIENLSDASYEKAQVTRGGVCLAELTDTLESVLQPGLFFAGEVADVDGTCGGYNLQWAFSSGTVAGRAIVKRNQELFKDDRYTMEENDGISERNRRR